MLGSLRQQYSAELNRVRLIGLVVLAGGLIAVPHFFGSAKSSLFIEFFILFLFAASYDLLIGYSGVISFGHALPFGLAAYVMGITLSGQPLPGLPASGVSLPLAIITALVVVTIVSVVVGWIAFQQSGVYFAMITLALSMVGYYVVFESTEVTGGSDGLLIFPSSFLGLPLTDYVTVYYVSLVVVSISALVMWRLTKSPFGRVLIIIRENEERARFLGYDTFRYKLAVFVIAGFFAGVAGILQGLYTNIVVPDLLYWSTGGDALLTILIGGMGTLWGAALGAAFFIGVEQLLSGVIRAWPILLGVVYVIFVMFFPAGLAGAISSDEQSLWDVVSDIKEDED